MKKLLAGLGITLLLSACATTAPNYNQQQFTTDNYRTTLVNAIDYADNFVDFDKEKIPSANLDSDDMSRLLKADIAYNQGDYASSAETYYELADKYHDPRLIYKAIVCYEHGTPSPTQMAKLEQMMHALVAAAPDSQVGKIFGIRLALESNDLSLAKDNLNSVVSDNPEKTRALFLLVATILSDNLNQSARANLSPFGSYVTKKYADYPEAWLLAVVAASLNADYNGLITNLDYIRNHYPTWDVPTYWMAGILMKSQNFAVLGQVMEHEVMSTPHPSAGIQNLYVAALSLRDHLHTANKYLESQIALTPESSNLWIDSAIVNYKLGNYPLAIGALNKAQTLGSNLNGSVDLALGALYEITTNNESAIEHYKVAQSLNPAFISVADLSILRIYVKTKNYPAANSFVDQMVNLTKTNPHDALLVKISMYSGMAAYDEAYKLAAQGVKKYPKDKQFVYYYASLSALTGRTAEGIKWYRKYIKMVPSDPMGYNDLGFLLADKTTNYAEALKLATKAYQSLPNDPAVQDTYGWANYKLGSYSVAESAILKAYTQTQDHDTAVHLQQVYLAQGNKDAAAKVIIISPQTKDLQYEQAILNQIMQVLTYYQFGMELSK